MKHTIWASVILLLFLMSCQTSNIAVDYDRTVNFNEIKTYDYYEGNPIQLNEIENSNFMKSLDLALNTKGLVRNTDNPDIYVAVKVEKREGKQTNIVNLGIGGGGDWVGIGTNIGIPISKSTMNYDIQLDFDRATDKNLIWTGHTSRSLSFNASSKGKDNFFKLSVESLLKKYPPKSEKANYYN